MSTPAISRELCEEAFELVQRYGDKAKASRATGIPTGTLHNRLKRGADLYGLGGATAKPAPSGHVVTGTSTLVNPQTGEAMLEWVKTKAETHSESAKDALIEAFQGFKGSAPKIQVPSRLDKDMLTVYPIADHHLGLYAWAEEAGDDYDLEIGEKVLKTAMGRLVDASPPSETAIILNLGDFFHSDTSMNKTLRSGHVLDVDTRFSKVLRVGVELLVDCINAALEKHKRVFVRCLPGNHDEHTAQALTIALAMFYRGKKRVDIDEDPSRFFMHHFGQNMLAATHGDMIKLPDMAGVMAARYPAEWGATKHRVGFQGHVHQKSVIEKNGATCETLNTLTAKDAWSAGMGYTSARAMRAITYHREDGEVVRHTVTI